MKEELLNEQSYKKTSKVLVTIFTCVILLGLTLVILGIFKVSSTKNMEIPEMGEPNWFEMNKEKNESEFAGTAMIMFGVFISIAGGMMMTIPYRRKIMAYQLQQMMPLAQEGLEKMTPTVTKVSKKMMEDIAPTVGKVGKEIMEDMAPAYGKMAKEISKGIKEGLKDEEK